MSRKKKKKKYSEPLIEHDESVAVATVPPKTRQVMTAADRRNWFRKQAGWPALKEK